MSLDQEIDAVRKKISTDGYPMSIGELISLYEKNEIDLHPEFQRFFRWTTAQKSRLIESILMGIPIPPIFVSQRKDGVWDVIDGLQRLSTIFEFCGILKSEDGAKKPPLILEKTRYLPSLQGMKWEPQNGEDQEDESAFSQTQRLLVKRAKLGVTIVTRESDEQTKYELFQRLNTGGSQLSDQEVRNCVMVMIDQSLFHWVRDLSKEAAFVDTTILSDRQQLEQYDLELVLRFVALREKSEEELKAIGDVGEALDDFVMTVSNNKAFDREVEASIFRGAFTILDQAMGDDAFRRFDAAKGIFSGGFLVSAYEAISCGVAANLPRLIKHPEVIEPTIQKLWGMKEFTGAIGSGVRATQRLPKILPIGKALFAG